MITKAVFLFLFGATLTSGQYFPRLHLAPYGLATAPVLKPNGCPSGPELAPLICKFMQPNIGLQFKPQLLEPSTYIAPLVVEKCDTPKLQMEIELPPPVEEMKPLVIPEAPILPPMTIPKFPVPIIFEEPPAPLPEPCESAGIPEIPAVIPIAPELPPMEIHELPHIEAEPYIPGEPIPEIKNTIEYMTVPVPPAPELPAFVMPEIPIHIVDQKLALPAAPCLHDEPIPAPIPAYIEPVAQTYAEPLAPLPNAPELPAFVMPELPIQVVEQALPVPAAPRLEDEPIPAPIPTYVEPVAPAYVEPLAPVLIAPELPAFVMPELPIQVVEQALPMPAAPCLEGEPISVPVPSFFEPIVPLPAAPELPAFVMPKLPIPVPIPAYRQPYADLAYNMVDYEPVPVPQAPELPAFVMPELPIHVMEQALPLPAAPCLDDELKSAHIEPLVHIPDAPELPAAPLPEFPVRVEIPSMPMIIEQPIEVPQAPELPAFTMPELPIHIAEDLSVPIVPEYIESLASLPAAPELPPASLPELPIRMEIPSPPAIIAAPEPFFAEEKAPEPIRIPLAPMLPEIKMPELPIRMEIEKPAPCELSVAMPNPFYPTLFPSHATIYNEQAKETQNILVPNLVESGAYPTPCVYNLVMKHVLPNIASHNFRSMENIHIKPASFLPCS